MDFIVAVSIAFIVIAVTSYLWERHRTHQTWRRLGIPGPKTASLLFGNLKQVLKEGRYPKMQEWSAQYGKVYGYYECGTPVMVTSDPDMAREIFIKQFDKFEARQLIIDNSEDPYNSLVDQKGEKWKKVRDLSSPTFSAKRMKQMSPLVQQSIDKLIARLTWRADVGDAFDMFADIKRMSLDVIASSVFSYDTDVFNDENSIFLVKLMEFLHSLDYKNTSLFNKTKLLLASLFPRLICFLRPYFPRSLVTPNKWFMDLAERMIEHRRNSKEYRPDYIHLMLTYGKSSSTADDETDDKKPSNGVSHDLKNGEREKELTMNEMQGQIFVFLVAGYETTATTVAYMCYYLALYPDVQSKLQKEIDEYFPDSETKPVNYETVQPLPYLDMVFCEASRLGCIGQIATTRMSKEDTEVCEYRVPKGAKVVVNMMGIHRNPEYWGPEPAEEFVPERFTKDRKASRHPMAFIPFGAGPKFCIGQRFALMEGKMAMINILKRFTIIRCSETQAPIRRATDGIPRPADGVTVKIVKRE